jgi:hypothetical protein
MKQIILVLMLAAPAFTGLRAQQGRQVTAGELRTWCTALACDEMRGRKNGSPEMVRAAEYIAAGFREAGLKPVSAAGFLQEYTYKDRSGRDLRERNVIGILEGSDPLLKDEWILLSAHFDHIGVGKPVNGDSIFNGADDNATGTITVMALARMLAASGEKPKRTIVFAAFSGEENGAHGSKWFLGHPPMPIGQMKLNLNFEMEGESATLGKNRYILTGHQFTDFDDLLDRYNKDKGWEVARTFKSPEGVFFASDNATFAVKRDGDKATLNIPAFTIVTTDDISIIHKVTDEPQNMDYDNMVALVSYMNGLVIFLSGDPLNLHWDTEAFNKFNRR